MGTHFEELMAKKSDAELTEYISNIDRYAPEAITAVINEFKKRGRNYTDDELKSINEKIQKKIEIEEDDDIFKSSISWKKNIVTDADAPLFYSQGAIWAFSVILTVIFGAVLLSLNIDNKKNKLKVIGFGVLFTSFAIIIGNLTPHSLTYTFLINISGGYFLRTEFWNSYIGRETKYRAKSIWKPLIISAIILIPFILAAIYSNK